MVAKRRERTARTFRPFSLEDRYGPQLVARRPELTARVMRTLREYVLAGFDLAVLDFVEAIGRALLPTANGFSLHTKCRHRSAILNERALTIRAHPILHLDPLQLDILLR